MSGARVMLAIIGTFISSSLPEIPIDLNFQILDELLSIADIISQVPESEYQKEAKGFFAFGRSRLPSKKDILSQRNFSIKIDFSACRHQLWQAFNAHPP